jgi:hypothetical protein
MPELDLIQKILPILKELINRYQDRSNFSWSRAMRIRVLQEAYNLLNGIN